MPRRHGRLDWPGCAWFVRERSTLPPEISLRGASPNQEQKCLTLGNLLISVPISEMIVCTLEADKPITATRSTPKMCAICARTLKFGSFLDFEPGLALGRSGSGASFSPRDSIA